MEDSKFIKDIKFHIILTPEQHQHMNTIRWLVGTGPNRSGRTFLLAIAFVEKAAKNWGKSIHVYDHTGLHNYVIYDMIRHVFEMTNLHEKNVLVLDRKRSSVKIIAKKYSDSKDR